LQEIALPPFECRDNSNKIGPIISILNRDGTLIFHAAGVSFVDWLEGASKPESCIA
jgi:hypothetical protein